MGYKVIWLSEEIRSVIFCLSSIPKKGDYISEFLFLHDADSKIGVKFYQEEIQLENRNDFQSQELWK